MSTLLHRIQVTFWCVGALLCGFVIGAYFEGRFFQKMENYRLEEALRQVPPNVPPANLTTHSKANAGQPKIRRSTGSLVGRVEIPRLHVSAIVLEGSDTRTLSHGVGRIPETADLGQAGNVVLGGHRDTFFRPLRAIRRGDRINMVTAAGSYTYQVDWTSVVDPTDNSSLKSTKGHSLTLVTCYPFYYVGPAPQRLIVRAHQVVPGVLESSTD